MPPKHKAGGCGCCSETCQLCTALTYVTISGLTSGGYCSGCEGKNGSYVFKTSGSSACGNYFINLGGVSCGSCPDSNPGTSYTLWFIGHPCCGFAINGSHYGIGITISNVSGKIRVQVSLFAHYYRKTIDCNNGAETNIQCGSYTAQWQNDFSKCSDIPGTPLTRISTDGYACDTADGYGDTGDLCGIFGATVSIG